MPDTKITKDAALATLGLTEDDLMQAHLLINDGLANGGFKADARQRLAHASKRFLRAFEAEGPVADTVRDAAPELLKALIDAAAMLEVYTYLRGRVNESTSGQARSTVRKARATIAKAGGR